MDTVCVEFACDCSGSALVSLPDDQVETFINEWRASHQDRRCMPSVIVIEATDTLALADDNVPEARPEQCAWLERQLAALDQELADRR